MAGLNIAEKRLPQDGRISLKIAGKSIDVRVSTIPTSQGERVVLRLLDKSTVLLDLTDLGFAMTTYTIMNDLIKRPHGIILVTGPTGSGKTTTLYAALSVINKPDLNILTVEDPVEYDMLGINQMQVNPKIALTFASGLRSFLRQDPDVIMVGEIRDRETAEIAIHASLTGHLVLSTIHTNDAAGALTRLVEMGIEPFLVASSMLAMLAQRLVRVLCKECREPFKPTDEQLAQIGLNREKVGRFWSDKAGDRVIYRAKGCEKCAFLGYKGRTGIYELLLVTDSVRSLILRKDDSNTIKRGAITEGMLTLRDDGGLKVLQGVTTLEEVMRVSQEEIS
jgi:general secretion pathway protein E